MGSLTDLKRMIQDRVESDTGIAKLEHKVCLDAAAKKKLDVLEARAEEATDKAKSEGRLAAFEDPELDAQLSEARAAVKATTVTVVFRALPGEEYQKILIKHDGYLRDAQLMDDMIHDLSARCYRYVIDADGDKVELPLPDLTKAMNHGQWDSMTDAVLLLNREDIDVPF